MQGAFKIYVRGTFWIVKEEDHQLTPKINKAELLAYYSKRAMLVRHIASEWHAHLIWVLEKHRIWGLVDFQRHKWVGIIGRRWLLMCGCCWLISTQWCFVDYLYLTKLQKQEIDIELTDSRKHVHWIELSLIKWTGLKYILVATYYHGYRAISLFLSFGELLNPYFEGKLCWAWFPALSLNWLNSSLFWQITRSL